jgi:DNA-binding transcriptional ArsR family regulator
LSWDIGTAYDLFLSLLVLHQAEQFGVRPSWAAGVRSRLPADERKVLEDSQDVIHIPLPWIYRLPAPKDASSALQALRQIPPADRLPALAITLATPSEEARLLQEVARRRSWTEADLETLRGVVHQHEGTPRTRTLVTILDWWARPDEAGEQYLQALQAYQQVFFAEEEKHIAPFLPDGLAHAQELAVQLTIPDLLTELSQGVHFEALEGVTGLILAPSFWSTPFIAYNRVDAQTMLVVYGARPADISLVAGEVVPDALLRALKALADPTRLRILRYLSSQPLTPSGLSRRLRLRPPTVTHHLHALRSAGLVHLTVSAGEERRYTARLESITAMFSNLEEYLESDIEQKDGT